MGGDRGDEIEGRGPEKASEEGKSDRGLEKKKAAGKGPERGAKAENRADSLSQASEDSTKRGTALKDQELKYIQENILNELFIEPFQILLEPKTVRTFSNSRPVTGSISFFSGLLRLSETRLGTESTSKIWSSISRRGKCGKSRKTSGRFFIFR